MADGFVLHVPPSAVITRAGQASPPSRAALAETDQQIRADFPDLRVEVEDLVANQDTVAARDLFGDPG